MPIWYQHPCWKTPKEPLMVLWTREFPNVHRYSLETVVAQSENRSQGKEGVLQVIRSDGDDGAESQL